MIEKELFQKYKDTRTSDIYLSSGVFSGTNEERLLLSGFIKELLVFFMPNHIIPNSEKEVKEILVNSTLESLWNTCCTLYQEEVERSKINAGTDILQKLELHEGSEEEKLATLIDIRDLVYTHYFNRILHDENETPLIEALRKAYSMDAKERLLNKDHTYDFFSIALKNFALSKDHGDYLQKLFEEVRDETVASLKGENETKEKSTLS